jgi:uncharacterized RmlC-like cupin family protein
VPIDPKTITTIGPDQRTTLPGPPGAGFVRQEVLSDGPVWVGVVTTEPGTASPWHHHGEHQTYVYVLEGEATVEFGEDGEQRRTARADGAVHVLPGGLVHREINEGATPNKMLVIRVGTGPAVFAVERPPS